MPGFGEAVCVLVQRWRISRSSASGFFLRLVRKYWDRGTCLSLRVTVVLIISMIQLIPGQFALMCSGASFDRISQMVSRLC